MVPNLTDLVGQYPVLTTLARYISTLDLFHLGLTSQAHHALILSSPRIFDIFKRDCLCDGAGLRRRVERYVLKGGRDHYIWGQGRKIHYDEEIEVRLFARKCDEAGALPCLRCGINVCEECRECPRVVGGYGQRRRPHLRPDYSSVNVMSLCDSCDAEIEERLAGKFLNALCDCDTYRRWICTKCVSAEAEETNEYYRDHTVGETSDYDQFIEMYDKTKRVLDHQFERLFYCTCGSVVPQSTIPRCTWCKRRHRQEAEWGAESREMNIEIPGYVDDDGCYPIYSWDYEEGIAWNGYPRLRYAGPIYRGPTHDSDGLEQ